MGTNQSPKITPTESAPRKRSERFRLLNGSRGADTGTEQQKINLVYKEGQRGRMNSIEGRARFISFSQKKGKSFLGAGVPRQRSMEEAESVSAGAIKYCRSRKNIKSKRKRGLGWTKI